MKFNNLKKPLIIAEIGSNYNQSLNTAYRLIDIAKECGADFAKFQLFDASKLYSKNSKFFKIFKLNELNSKWINLLKKHSDRKKIGFLCSVFDRNSASVLYKNNVTNYKLASSELNNFELIKYLSKLKIDNLILSTGMSNLSDVQEAFEFCKLCKIKNISLMQCTSLYPANYKELNLNVIKTYKKIFNVPVGFSDHSLDNLAAVVSIGAGATLVEKHITLDKRQKGPDHFYALNPDEFRNYIREVKNAFRCLGSYSKFYLSKERESSRNKGLYAKKNIPKNTVINSSMINISNPPKGIEAKHFNKLIGMKVNKNLKKKDPIHWEDLN